MQIKQSVCIPILKPAKMPLAEFIARVAEIGYPAVEIWNRDAEFDALVSLTHKHNLRIVSMIGHGMDIGGLNDPSKHEAIEAALKESIDIAAFHGIPGVICFSGNRREGLSDREGIENSIVGLRRMAPYAEKKGINLNFELLNSKVDHAGYQFDHMAWGKEVVERVDSPRVKLLYDIYHAQIMDGDIIRTIQKNIGWIGHFHTAGVPGRHEFNESQELNYAAIARAISATSYDLYLGHEFSPVGEVFSSLREAFEICNQSS
jgi:hydroxypyruvate isomerase